MPMLTVGDKFPEYKMTASVGTEKGKEFKSIATKDNKGKWLVFYAYPKDFTFICPTEIVEFSPTKELEQTMDVVSKNMEAASV